MMPREREKRERRVMRQIAWANPDGSFQSSTGRDVDVPEGATEITMDEYEAKLVPEVTEQEREDQVSGARKPGEIEAARVAADEFIAKFDAARGRVKAKLVELGVDPDDIDLVLG